MGTTKKSGKKGGEPRVPGSAHLGDVYETLREKKLERKHRTWTMPRKTGATG